jgi:hypothetical protein
VLAVAEALKASRVGRIFWAIDPLGSVEPRLASGGDAVKRRAGGFRRIDPPGHVPTIAGTEKLRFVARQHGTPSAAAGFTAAYFAWKVGFRLPKNAVVPSVRSSVDAHSAKRSASNAQPSP